MDFSEITYATRELTGNADEMITCEMANGDYIYAEFVEVDYVAETLTVREDGKVVSYSSEDLSDVTVGEDY